MTQAPAPAPTRTASIYLSLFLIVSLCMLIPACTSVHRPGPLSSGTVTGAGAGPTATPGAGTGPIATTTTAFAAATGTPKSRRTTSIESRSGSRPDRQPAIYIGAGMAGKNNPDDPDDDEDNLTVAIGARIPIDTFSLRPEVHFGDNSTQFTPSITYDFAIAGSGEGAIDGNIGLGYSINSNDENNILGNESSAFLRLGAEGYLVSNLLVGAALMIAPWGYNRDDLALAGTVYFGVRF